MLPLAQRYKLVVQYKGTNFIGWQKQSLEAKTNKRSIQTLLEQAIKGMCGEDCEVVTAGRTDTGVHSYANCAHVDIIRRHKKTKEVLEPFPALTVKRATNYYLKRHTTDIYVSHVETVEESFHARFSCQSRSYVYRIINSNDVSGLPFINDLVYWIREEELDIEKMREASRLFIGTIDFTSFCTATEGKIPIRTLHSIEIKTENTAFDPSQTAINIYVKAKSFLWHQVRKIVGALLAVGRGTMTIARLKEVMEAKDVSIAPAMAPACGLYFHQAEYEPYKILDSSAYADQEFSGATQKKRKREDEDDSEQPPKKLNIAQTEEKRRSDEE